jgi:hypothetical protein
MLDVLATGSGYPRRRQLLQQLDCVKPPWLPAASLAHGGEFRVQKQLPPR